jgi:hypothetical protein
VFTVNPPGPAVLTLTSVFPSIGVQGSSVPITLTGTKFVAGALVAVNNAGISVGSVVVVSATQITAILTIPPTAPLGAVGLVVTTSDGTSSAVAFTVFSSSSNVTSVTRLNVTGHALNRGTGLFLTIISVTNTGTTTLAGPLYILLDWSTSGVATLQGLPTVYGIPYATINLSSGLAPGATTASLILYYTNPTNAPVGYVSWVFNGGL